ncbi:GntR family transcriptional regulator [Bordetella genomosp. 12]|uniref:HTH gntR-type domain-containing protein n=1 Tax=Bordetella genomosp. 12 TaxID=463035 RepID=A0A261VCI9_9BORD|nr:GntR family transcriptional regulator [Bordetella genomosp. 12]OZI71262.1 hypothetical protein CAL22_15525 [Bordetella genomosp. 12]
MIMTMDTTRLAAALGRFQRTGVPKYTALRDAIVHAVASGQLQAGDRVPNEQELAATLPISLGTIQRALRQLADEGVIERRHGLGSFVSGRQAGGEMSHPFHCRFVNDSGDGYLPVFPKVVERKEVGEGEWTPSLGPGRIVEITRKIRIGSEFDVYSVFWIDAARLPIFATAPLDQLDGQNFKDLIFRATGQTMKRVDIFLSQRPVNERIAESLGLTSSADCIALRAIGYVGTRDAVYYQHIYIPPNERELHVVTEGLSRTNEIQDGLSR